MLVDPRDVAQFHVMMVPVGRGVLRDLDPVAVEGVDLADFLAVSRDDVHMFADL